MPQIKAGGISFNTQILGEGGEVVVFLHGLVMDNLSSWYFTYASKIATFARVLLYDLRGHGLTERTPSGYRIEDMCEDLSAILDFYQIHGPVHLVGNSFGGMLALGYAEKYPQRVASLCLVDAMCHSQDWVDRMAATLRLEGHEAEQAIAVAFKDWYGRHSSKKRNRLIETARSLINHTTMVEDIKRSRTLTTEELKKLSCPTMLIYGELSEVLAVGASLANDLPHTEFHVLPNCSHAVIWEATEEVGALLEKWLTGHCGYVKEAM
jgi:pimeloyl-ACP methyl ester carboxylesterase